MLAVSDTLGPEGRQRLDADALADAGLRLGHAALGGTRVSFSVQIGLLLALATAFVSILGFLFKHRGAVAAPTVTLRAPVKSTVALFSNGWWTLGLVVATASWGFHVAALALAPITLVQSIIAGGLVLLTVVADRLFGFDVRRREWVGVALTAVGLAFLAATLGESAESAFSDYSTGTLTTYVGAVALGSFVVVAAAERSAGRVGVAAGRGGGPAVGRLRRGDQGPVRPPVGGRAAGAGPSAGGRRSPSCPWSGSSSRRARCSSARPCP